MSSTNESTRTFSTSPDQEFFLSKPRRNTTTGHSLPNNSSHIASTPSSNRNVGTTTNYSEYLDFKEPVYHSQTFSSTQSPTKVNLTAHLSGQFSLSPITQGTTSSVSSNSSNSDEIMTPEFANSPLNSMLDDDLELTFYRRNLFQVSCVVSNIPSAAYAMSPSTGKMSRIMTMSMEISIVGTDETKTPKLLYVPRKPDSNKPAPKQSNAELEPKTKILGGQAHSQVQTEVVDWKRLQFRYATTHNGRRRLQNYFNLKVTLFAELDTRERVSLVHVDSKPIVVRGRNPQFYKSRKTIHITDSTTQTNEFAAWRETAEGKRRSSEASDHSIAVKPEDNSEHTAPERVKRAKTSSYISEEAVVKKEEKVAAEDSDDEDSDSDKYEYFAMPSHYLTGPVDSVFRPHSMVHTQTLHEETSSLKRTYATATASY